MSDQQQKHTGVILRARRDLGHMTLRDHDFYEAGMEKGRRDAIDELKDRLVPVAFLFIAGVMATLLIVAAFY